MSKYSMQVTLRNSNGNSSSYNVEVQLPDQLDSKIGNSSYKQDIVAVLHSALPQMLGGWDWRKQGSKVESFNNVRKV
jgi:hypothetical protein